MANTVKIKRSSVSGKAPTTSQLELGELAVNTYDGKLYTKKDDGTASIVEIGGGGVSDGDKGDVVVSNGGTTWTVEDDSHNHIISNVDGLQTALDAKLPKSGGQMTGNITFAGSQTVDGRDLSVDGAKLDGIAAGAEVNVDTNLGVSTSTTSVTITSSTGSNTTIGEATGTAAGVMSTAHHNKLDGIESGATADQTAAEILAAVKTVDGGGSGLDADLLDGQQGSYYQAASSALTTSTSFGGDVSGNYNNIVVANDSHSHSFNNLTGKTSGTGDYATTADIVSGKGSGGVALTINDGYGNANVTWNHQDGVPEQNGNAARIEVNTDATSGATMWFEGKSGVSANTGTGLNNWFTMSDSGATCLGNTVWHAGNDGAGSGLDADTVDGLQASSFVRSDANDTVSGQLTFNANILMGGTGAIKVANGTTAQRPSASNGMVRYNTTLGCLEAYVQSAWQVIANTSLDYGLITAGTATTFDYGAI